MTELAIAALLVLAGTVHALSFAPDPISAWLIGPTNITMLALLITAIWAAPSRATAVWRGWIFSVSSFCVGLYWLTISMNVSGHMPLPLAGAALFALSAYLAIYPAAAAYLAYRFKPSRTASLAGVLAWASSWTLTEWLRGTVFTGFPWLNTGYSQLETYLGGWAALGGVYLVTFLSALLAGLLALVVFKPLQSLLSTKRSILNLTAACLVTLGGGWQIDQQAWTTPAGDPLNARLVQGGIEQDMKFEPEKILAHIEQHRVLALGSTLAEQRPALVLIPETAMTVFQDQVSPSVWQAWINLASEQNSTIMLGAPLLNRQERRYTNSVIAIDQDTPLSQLTTGQVDRRYDKHHLVPFGEFIPWGFRWFVDLLHIQMGDFDRGLKNQTSFKIREQLIGPNICYEDVFGEELIATVDTSSKQTDATILANFSNLAWFGDSWALRQHWQMSRMRAIETSRPMLRSTNTGITGAIDHKGHALGTLPTMLPGILDITVQGQRGQTPYARLGNMPILLLSLGFLIWLYIRQRTTR